MCGNGTNDVGALIHSHFGVALLSSGGSNHPEAEQKKKAKFNEAQVLTNEDKNASSIFEMEMCHFRKVLIISSRLLMPK